MWFLAIRATTGTAETLETIYKGTFPLLTRDVEALEAVVRAAITHYLLKTVPKKPQEQLLKLLGVPVPITGMLAVQKPRWEMDLYGDGLPMFSSQNGTGCEQLNERLPVQPTPPMTPPSEVTAPIAGGPSTREEDYPDTSKGKVRRSPSPGTEPPTLFS